MEQGIFSRIAKYLSDKRRRGRWQKVVSVMAIIVVFVTTYALILPAITMEGKNPKLEAELITAVYGNGLTVEITAEAEDDKEETIFFLSAKAENAGLSEKYIFDDLGTAKVIGHSDEEISIKRHIDESGNINYWFVLEKGEKVSFPLEFVNGIGAPDVTTWVEEVSTSTENTDETSNTEESALDAKETVISDEDKLEEAVKEESFLEPEDADIVQDAEVTSSPGAELTDSQPSETEKVVKTKVTFEEGNTEAEGSLQLKSGRGDTLENAINDASESKDDPINLAWREVVEEPKAESDLESETVLGDILSENGSAVESDSPSQSNMAIIPLAAPVEEIASGAVTDTISWRIEKDENGIGTLIIEGTGEMPNYSSSSNMPWKNTSSSINELKICEGITKIGKYNFASLTNMKKVYFPSTLKEIGESAFYNCRFVSLTIPEGVEVIGYRAFNDCRYLVTLNLPNTLLEIGGGAFSGCALLKEIDIPGSLETISNGAFKDCKGLSKVTFHEGLKEMGSEVFLNCISLKSITFPEGFLKFDGSTFSGCYLDTLVLPSTVNSVKNAGSCGTASFEVLPGEGESKYFTLDGVLYENGTDGIVTLLGYPRNSTRKSFTVPAIAQTIADGAIVYAVSLEEITFPATLTERTYGMSNCTNLKKVTFADNVKFISVSDMFENTIYLKEAILPDGSCTIFNDTYNNSSIESVNIPDSIQYIMNKTFSNCISLNEVRYNAMELLGEVSNTVFGTAEVNFNLIIGKDVNLLRASFSEFSSRAKSITFEPDNKILVTENAFKGAPEPLTGLSGTLYANSNGLLYSYKEGEYGAKLVYCPPEMEAVTVPGTLVIEGNSYTVNEIGVNAFKQANKIASITFANPAAIDTVNPYAMANCPTLTSVNGQNSLTGAEAVFAAISDMDSTVFYNTGLEGAINVGNIEDGMHGTKSIELSASNGDRMKIEATTSDYWVGDDNTGGYVLPTGQNQQLKITVEPIGGGSSKYKIYFHRSENDCNFGVVPSDEPYVSGSISYMCYGTDNPDTIYIEFDVNAGETYSFYMNQFYPSPSSDGGGLTVWGEIIEAGNSKVESNDRIYSHWRTEAEPYNVEKSITNPVYSLKGDGKGNAILSSDYKWTIELTHTPSLLGKDPVSFVEYSEYFTMPKGASWSQEIITAVKSNKVVWDVIRYSSDKSEIWSASVNGTAIIGMKITPYYTTEALRLEWDEEAQNAVIRWKSINKKNAYGEYVEKTDETIVLTIYSGAIVFDLAEYTGATTTEKLRNNVDTTIHHVYAGAVEHTSMTEAGLSLSASRLNFNLKCMNSSFPYLGSDVSAMEAVIGNSGVQPYNFNDTLEHKVTVNLSTDPTVGAETYIKDSNMEKMFREEYGKDLTVTIRKAELAQWIPVTDVKGDTAYKNVANSNASEFPDYSSNNTLVVKWDSERDEFIVTVNGSSVYKDSTVAGALQKAGYAVNRFSEYVCEWSLNKAGEKLVLLGGEERVFNVYTTAKDTFQMMTEDWKNKYPNDDEPVFTAKFDAYLDLKSDGSSEKNRSMVLSINKRDAYISKDGTVNGVDFDDNPDFDDGDVIDYNLYFRHMNSYYMGEYENLPMADDLYGSQRLIVPVDKNIHLSGLGLDTKQVEDVEYYILSEGEYSNVIVSEKDNQNFIAAKIVVKPADTSEVVIDMGGNEVVFSGLHTSIKWYFSEIESGPSIIDFDYKAIADFSIPSTENEGVFNIGNVIWMNDRKDGRIFETVFTGGTIVKFRKEIVESRGATPEEDVISKDDVYGVGQGNAVTYRITLNNTGDSGFSVFGQNIKDSLPKTFGIFEWNNSNIVDFECVTTGSTVADNIDKWAVGLQEGTTAADGQYLITWPSSARIKFSKAGDKAYLYFTLNYPNDGGVWAAYDEVLGGLSFTNSFYAYDFPSHVFHKVKMPRNVLLQKGVYTVGYAVGSYGSPHDLIQYNDRQHIANKGSDGKYVYYYVVIFNGDNERLYLNTIYDKIPEGFTYVGILEGYTHNNSSNVTTCTSFTEEIQMAEVSSYPGIDDITYKSAYLKPTKSTDGKGFKIDVSVPAVSKAENVKYDDEVGKCYLDKGEAITFGYYCQVGEEAATGDFATNTIAMPYTSAVGSQVELIDKDSLSVTGKINEYHSDLNDGTRQVYTGDQIDQYFGFPDNTNANEWIASVVNLSRGELVPGISKQVKSSSLDGITQTPYEGSTVPEASINWLMTLYNNGDTHMSNYTVADTIPAPYELTGKVGYKLYYANGTNAVSITLFNILGRSINSAGKKELSIEYYDYDNRKHTGTIVEEETLSISIRTSWTVSRAFDVLLTTDSEGNERISIKFLGENLAIQEKGGYAELDIWTSNKTNDKSSKVYINTAMVTPTEDFDRVSNGVIVKGADGSPESVKASAPVNIISEYATKSEKAVYEKGNEAGNYAVSSGTLLSTPTDKDYILLPSEGSTFTYKLSVKNDSSLAMTKLVLIDNLPHLGDTYSFSSTASRGSEFGVELAQNPNFKLTVTKENGSVATLVQGTDYRIEYSTSVEFDANDWSGASSSKWTSTMAGARSVRLVLNDSAGTKIPDKSKIDFTFDAVIDSDGAGPGAIAWNSFGYHYAVKDQPDELEAMPLVVGVKVPGVPTLIKEVINDSGEPVNVPEDTVFDFIIYKGDKLSDSYQTTDELKAIFDSKSIAYKLVSLTVPAGESKAEVLLDNIGWTWGEGQKYTVVELPFSESQSKLYRFYKFEGTTDNGYTFKYGIDATIVVTCQNLFLKEDWGIEITKFDSADQEKKLENAVFALYTQTESNGMGTDEYEALAEKPDYEIVLTEGGSTWYLMSVKSTDTDGKISWEGLEEEQYYLMEFKAPNGYSLGTDGNQIVYSGNAEDGLVKLDIENSQTFSLPESGGEGTLMYTLGGLLLILFAVTLLYKNNLFRKGGKANS